MFFNKLLPAVILLFSLNTAFALTDLKTVKNTIVTTLKREQPACVGEFGTFFKKYDDLVSNFFDKNNNDPLELHINFMETELQTLKGVCDDARYQSVHSILGNYYKHLTELVSLLKRYIGSHDTLSLALKVRKFKRILPETVKQQGDISLFAALQHRLTCKQRA